MATGADPNGGASAQGGAMWRDTDFARHPVGAIGPIRAILPYRLPTMAPGPTVLPVAADPLFLQPAFSGALRQALASLCKRCRPLGPISLSRPKRNGGVTRRAEARAGRCRAGY